MSTAREFIRTLAGAAVVGTVVLVVSRLIVPRSGAGTTSVEADQRRLDAHWAYAVASDASVLFVGGDSGLTLVEFGDYLCDACKSAHLRLVQALSDDGALRVVFRHAPNPDQPNSMTAALAAICADEQAAFRRMHDQLIAFGFKAAPEWAELAGEAEVGDIEEFMSCLSSSEARERLERDRTIASRLGVRGTPTFVTTDLIRAGLPSAAWLDSLAAVRR